MIWQGTVQQTHSCVPDALQQPSQCLQRASKSKPPLWYKWWSCLYKMLKPTWPSLHKNRPARKGKLNSPPLHMLGGSGASHQALTQPLIQPSVSSWPASSSPPSTAGHSIAAQTQGNGISQSMSHPHSLILISKSPGAAASNALPVTLGHLQWYLTRLLAGR